jgi:photosystem II stability/assembly factor-like uncharacterized protein
MGNKNLLPIFFLMNTLRVTTNIAVLILALNGCLTVALGQPYEWKKISSFWSFTCAQNPANPRSMLNGIIGSRVQRSYDGGDSWEEIPIPGGASSTFTSSVLWSSYDTNIVLAGGVLLTGVHRSTDGGSTFIPSLLPQEGQPQYFVSDAIVECPSAPNIVYAARFNVRRHVYRSTDVGATWDTVSTVPINLARRLCTITVKPDSASVLFLGCLQGIILRSEDSGRTWARSIISTIGEPLGSSSEIPKIVFNPQDPQHGYAVVFIGTTADINGGGGLLETRDGGLSWQQITLVDTSLWAVEFVRIPQMAGQGLLVGGFAVQDGVDGPGVVATFIDGERTRNPADTVPWGTNSSNQDDRDIWMIRQFTNQEIYMSTSNGLFKLSPTLSVNPDQPPRSMNSPLIVNRYYPCQSTTNLVHFYSLSGELLLQQVPEDQRVDLTKLNGVCVAVEYGANTPKPNLIMVAH